MVWWSQIGQHSRVWISSYHFKSFMSFSYSFQWGSLWQRWADLVARFDKLKMVTCTWETVSEKLEWEICYFPAHPHITFCELWRCFQFFELKTWWQNHDSQTQLKSTIKSFNRTHKLALILEINLFVGINNLLVTIQKLNTAYS